MSAIAGFRAVIPADDKAELGEWYERQPLVRACLFCGIEFVGTLATTREAWLEHQRSHGRTALRKLVVCDRHTCSRKTRHKSGLCPEHRRDALRNLKARGGPASKRPFFQ